MSPAYLTLAEAATYAAVSERTIARACERGDLRHGRTSDSPQAEYRIKPEWIDEWLENGRQGGGNG